MSRAAQLMQVLQRGQDVSKTDWKLLHVAVVALKDTTYVARLFFGDVETGTIVWDCDSRPSDACWLALKVSTYKCIIHQFHLRSVSLSAECNPQGTDCMAWPSSASQTSWLSSFSESQKSGFNPLCMAWEVELLSLNGFCKTLHLIRVLVCILDCRLREWIVCCCRASVQFTCIRMYGIAVRKVLCKSWTSLWSNPHPLFCEWSLHDRVLLRLPFRACLPS